MSERDGELMHLTAESTSEESSSLVTQTASRVPDREIKTGKKDAAKTWEWWREKAERESERDGHEWGRSLAPCTQHIFWYDRRQT